MVIERRVTMGREATRRRRTGGEGVWNRREAERGSNKRRWF